MKHSFSLREICETDLEFLLELHNDPFVLRNLTHPKKITKEEHLTWWNSVKNDNKQLRLIFTVDSNAAGLTKFYDIDTDNHNCTLGADIHSDFRGRGLAICMWNLMLQKCFEDLDLHRVSLTTAVWNTIAHRVYIRLGFQEEGKLKESLFRDGSYHDQIVMSLFKRDWIKHEQ